MHTSYLMTCMQNAYILFNDLYAECIHLRISYKDHVTNEEVCAKIQQAIEPHEDPLTIVKRRKLQLFELVSCSSGLAKSILQSTVKGGRKQGRQRKRWEDNSREWTGLEFAKSRRAEENREKWRKLVVKPSVVPQRPSRLRDRWWWWWRWWWSPKVLIRSWHYLQHRRVCYAQA